MAQLRLGSGLGRIRVPKPRKSSVVASVYFLLGVGVCLFHALYHQQSSSTYEYVDVTYPQVRVMVEQREMILVVQN